MSESQDKVPNPELIEYLEKFKGMEMVTNYREDTMIYTIENASMITDVAVIFNILRDDGRTDQVTVDLNKIKESGDGFEFEIEQGKYQIRPKQ